MLHRILCSLDKNYFLVTRVSNSCSYQKARWEKCPSYNICLIGRNKEREEHFPQPHMPYYSAPTHEDRWCFHYAKDPWNFVRSQIKDPFRFLLTGIDRFTRSDYRNLRFRFWQTGSLSYFSYVRNSEKELELLERTNNEQIISSRLFINQKPRPQGLSSYRPR